MSRHAFPAQGDAARGRFESSTSEFDRWPGAPEPRYDEDGEVTNAAATCSACGEPSTLSYRCGECGNDLATGGSA
ncbi:CxxC motif protein [Halorubrum phage Hardycor1]|nr:CxxC motif protein [Halorubrum phage Hardycor1]